jgi:hypothetical protein
MSSHFFFRGGNHLLCGSKLGSKFPFYNMRYGLVRGHQSQLFFITFLWAGGFFFQQRHAEKSRFCIMYRDVYNSIF